MPRTNVLWFLLLIVTYTMTSTSSCRSLFHFGFTNATIGSEGAVSKRPDVENNADHSHRFNNVTVSDADREIPPDHSENQETKGAKLPRGRPSEGKLTERRLVYVREKRERHFMGTWKIGRPWLQLNNENGTMFCIYCREYSSKVGSYSRQRNAFVEGTKTMKLQIVKTHEASELHLRCQGAAKLKRKSSSDPMKKAVLMADKANVELMKIRFVTAFKVAKCGQPYTAYPSDLKLMERYKGGGIANRYSSDKSCAQMVKYIAADLTETKADHVQKSIFFSVLCDGSTDTASLEEEIVYVRYVDPDGRPVTKFVCIANVEKPDAQHIYEHLVKCLREKLHLDDDLNGLIGFCADGAAVNFGTRSGVYKRFTENVNKEIVGIHCMAHRFELCQKYASKDSKTVGEVSELLQRIYLFYKSSSVQRAGLAESCKAHKVPFYSPVNVCGTRWISHRCKALNTLLKIWKPLVEHCIQVGVCVGSHRPEILGKSSRIKKDMTSVKYLFSLFILRDAFDMLMSISLAMQENCFIMSSMIPRIEVACKSLRAFDVESRVTEMQNHPDFDGQNLTFKGQQLHLERGQSFESTVLMVNNSLQQFVTSAADAIENRYFHNDFIEKGSVSNLASVFNPKAWPTVNDDAFGLDSVKKLASKFACTLEKNGFKLSLIELEWRQLLPFAKDVWLKEKRKHAADFYARLLTSKGEDLPNICALLKIIMVLPVSTAEAERGFSVMKRVKTDWRARLKADALSSLICVKLCDHDIDSFNPESAVLKWFSDTRRRPEGIKYYRKRKFDAELQVAELTDSGSDSSGDDD